MIRIENLATYGWEAAIRGMRNPKNSWERSDSFYLSDEKIRGCILGENDLKLAKKLADGGPVHGKFLRMIGVSMDVTAPLYWWKEADTYKVGTVANSCSTMHTIHKKPFERDDFSYEHLSDFNMEWLDYTIARLNRERERFNDSEGKDKEAWWQMIQMLPTCFNQKRTLMLNYAVLRNIYEYRKDHRLDEWRVFCLTIKKLPYAKELICGVD